MRSREQVVWDFVQAWLAKAQSDLRVAEILLGEASELAEESGFHCQQSAEKHMKAYLVRHQIEFSKTHDLAVLRRLIGQRDERLADRLAFADWLTPFGVEFRYPGEMPEVDRETAGRALADARRIGALILEALGEYLGRGRPESQGV